MLLFHLFAGCKCKRLGTVPHIIQWRKMRESVKLVEENRELAKNEYEAGEASLLRLNEAQRDLNRTYSRMAQAVVSFHRANQRLLAATGRSGAE